MDDSQHWCYVPYLQTLTPFARLCRPPTLPDIETEPKRHPLEYVLLRVRWSSHSSEAH